METKTPETLPFYPVSVAADEVGINPRTLYRWIASGKVECFYLPGDMKKTRKLVMLPHVKEYMRNASAPR